MVLIPFLVLVVLSIIFSVVPVLPGVPFAIVAVMLIPLSPPDGAADELTWSVAIGTGLVGLVIAVIDFTAPLMARMFERYLGQSSRRAAVGSVLGLFSGLGLTMVSICFGVTLPVLAVLPVPIMIVTPFMGAFLGEMTVTPPPGESGRERVRRMFRSALVQWLGLLTTLMLKLGYCIVVVPVGLWLVFHNWPA